MSDKDWNSLTGREKLREVHRRIVGRQGEPEIPAPQDDASAALAREDGYWHTLALRAGVPSPEAPVLTSDDEEGWITVITEPDEFDPGAEAAAIPFLPVSAAQMQRMRMRDAALEVSRAKEQRLRASTDPVDRLKVYMDRCIWADGGYGEPLDAEDAVEEVIRWLREERVLAQAWEDGFYAGQAYLAECCGCSGRGPEPANPYEPTEAPRVEVRAWGRNNAVRVYRGL